VTTLPNLIEWSQGSITKDGRILTLEDKQEEDRILSQKYRNVFPLEGGETMQVILKKKYGLIWNPDDPECQKVEKELQKKKQKLDRAVQKEEDRLEQWEGRVRKCKNFLSEIGGCLKRTGQAGCCVSKVIVCAPCACYRVSQNVYSQFAGQV
jgi:hypothetical protein